MYSELIRKTGTYSIALSSARAMSFVILPLYTRLLTPTDYGVMEMLDLTSTIVGLLFGTRVASALFYYYFNASDETEKDQVIGNLFCLSVVLGTAIFAATFPASGLISSLVFGRRDYSSYFQLLFAGFCCSLPVEVGYSCLRAHNRSGKFMRLTILQNLCMHSLNVIFLVLFHMGVRSMLWSALICSAFVGLFLTWSTLSPIKFSLNPLQIVRIFRYCFPLGLSGLAIFFIHYGDRIFLRRSVSLSALGVYGLAYKFGMVVAVIHAPFHLYWSSQICDLMRTPEGSARYARVTTLLFAGLSLATLILAFLSHLVIKVMAGPAFVAAAILVPWIAFAYLIRALGSHLQCVFTVHGTPGIELKVNLLGSLACVAAYAILIPQYRLWGAVGATVFGFSVILIYTYYEGQRLRPVAFEFGRIAGVAIAAGTTALMYYLARPNNLLLQAGLAIALIALYIVSMVVLCFSGKERKQITILAVEVLCRRTGTVNRQLAA
jgi:O-antigen/teichoic acid export membrane protein